MPAHVLAQEASKNPMIRRVGIGPKDCKCKDCKFVYKKEYNSKVYYKCKHLGNSNGAGTDIRLKWDACRLFGKEGESRLAAAVREATTPGLRV